MGLSEDAVTMSPNVNGSRPHVVFLGGGFAGLEGAFALHQQVGDRARITLVSDQDDFLFRPNSIYVPFGLDPGKLRVPLAKPLATRGIEFVRDRAVGVDPAAGTVELEGGKLLYDRLVIATGSDMRPEEIPGLADHAEVIWTVDEMLRLRTAFGALAEAGRRGERRRVHFVVPPNNKCAGPLYEVVLMLETWLRRRHARDNVEITWSTFESSFIQAFGPRLHDLVVDEFSRRGIDGHVDRAIKLADPQGVEFADGTRVEHDLLVSFPPYIAATTFPGLAADDRGFLATDLGTREVAEGVYAAGDAGDFPVKQAFLAFLQADVVATRIAADACGVGEATEFDPVSMCVMEQFDKATYAKVPLRLTGDPARPVEVRPDAHGDYRVGSSLAWRGGKKLLGLSVPWRFSHGRPFHSGPFWAGMEVGLKGMAGVLAKGSP